MASSRGLTKLASNIMRIYGPTIRQPLKLYYSIPHIYICASKGVAFPSLFSSANSFFCLAGLIFFLLPQVSSNYADIPTCSPTLQSPENSPPMSTHSPSHFAHYCACFLRSHGCSAHFLLVSPTFLLSCSLVSRSLTIPDMPHSHLFSSR